MRFLSSLIIFLFLATPCFAVMSANITFEFRSTATANMVNGGGFKTGATGTNYSTQDAAQWTNTDLTCAVASTNVVSLGSTFTAAAVGNVMHITAGTNMTVGWYEITAYVDANTVTLDRTPSPTLAGLAGTFYIGGALNVGGSLEDDFFEAISGTNAADGITVYFYNNNTTTSVTFIPSEAVVIGGTGGIQAPIRIIGYKTTRGDNPTGDSRPTIINAANDFALGANIDTYNLIFSVTNATGFTHGTGAKSVNVKSVNSSTTADRAAFVGNGDSLFYNCEGISYRGRAINTASVGSVIGCYLHDSNIGFRYSPTSALIVAYNIIESNITAAILLTGALSTNSYILHNTLYGSENTTGTGISIATGTTDLRVLNNIIYGFATGVSHADTQTVGYDDYNDYFNNDTDVTNWTKGSNDQALDPTFTSVAQVTGTTATYAGSTLTDAAASFSNVVDSQDFVLIVSGTGLTTANCQYLITSHTATTITTSQDAGESSASDWVYQVTTGRNFAIGTNLKALGFPGAFQAGLTTGYLDIGAVQRQEATASSGGAVGALFNGGFEQ